jgi:hypothetical protein
VENRKRNARQRKNITDCRGHGRTISDKVRFKISGSNEMLELVPDSQGATAAASMDGRSVLVEGTVSEGGAKSKAPISIRYWSVVEQQSK